MNKYRSSMRNPCPICGRTKDGDCAVDEDESGLKVRCHTHLGDAGIEGFVYRGQTECGMWGLYYSVVKDESDHPKAIRAVSKQVFFYPNSKGDPLAKVVRTDDGKGNKKFAQWHRTHGKGIEWALGLPEQIQKQVRLYRIRDDVNQDAITNHEPILVVEGEGKVDLLLSMGIAATCAIGGAGKWRRYGYPNYLDDLLGTSVVLVPDRDVKGMAHMEDVEKDFSNAQWLYPYPDSPLWNKLPEKGGLDIADWIEDFKLSKVRIMEKVGSKRKLSLDESKVIDLNEGLTYEQTIQKLEKIFEIEDEALQLWELDRLASCVKRSPSRLVQIWDTYQNDSTPFKPIELHDFLKREELERSWLIAGYIPAGTVIGLIAGGGSGKTLLTYDLIKAIATGQSWNGFRATQTKVLIVQTDEQFLDTKERLEIANYQEAISAGTVFLLEKWQFTQFRRLAKFIKDHKIGFCAIDSFTSTNRRSNGEEKDSSYASCIYDLRDLASETKCSFLVLHHTNRAGGSRGTTAFEDNVSETWFLKIPEPSANLSSEHRILQIKKSRSSCNGTFKILLDVNDYSWLHEGDHKVFSEFEDNNSQPPLSARIQEYLEANRGQHFSPDELIYVRSLSDCKNRDAMRKQLERLRKKGLIDAEDVVKDAGGVSGKQRYKVYFAPCVNEPCPDGTKPAPSMDFYRLDTPQDSITYVQTAELSLGLHSNRLDNHYSHTEDNQ